MTNRTQCIGGRAGLAAILALAILAVPAYAGEAIFPVGSRVGIVPPAGMTLSEAFAGFEDRNNRAIIVVGALPAAVFSEMAKTSGADVLKKEGVTVEKRESLQLPVGNALLIVGTQVGPDNTQYRKWMLAAAADDMTALASMQAPLQSKVYTDAVARAALSTLAVRPIVPLPELLSMLPFTIGDLAGFRIENIIRGRAVLLIDGQQLPHLVTTDGIPEYALDGRMMITALPGVPASNDDRASFARLAFNSIGGIKDVQMTMSEPVRIGHEQAFETVARAKDIRTGSDVMVVQWLRFGDAGFLQIAGVSRADIWDSELTRLRTVRDSVNPR